MTHIAHTDVPTASELLQFDVIGTDRFRACRNLDNYADATFGGQALCQALAAAQRTVPGWPANSLNGYFLRRGIIDQPVEFAVERVNQSRRFAARRVLASQGGRPMFDMLCSFHDPDAGVQHQYVEIGEVPPPESLVNLQTFMAVNAERLPARSAVFSRPFPIELRMLDWDRYFESPGLPRRDFWFRIPSAAGIDSPQDHQALLALASDYWFPGVVGTPHMGKGTLRSLMSLNESLWFHHAVRTDEWLLYRTESQWADHGRGLARGLIFDRQGRLAATVSQEALLRLS